MVNYISHFIFIIIIILLLLLCYVKKQKQVIFENIIEKYYEKVTKKTSR
jgi:hypothetical protein